MNACLSTATSDANHRYLSVSVRTLGQMMAKSALSSEELMAETETANSQPRFNRRSDTESICAFCFLLISGDRYTALEEAEDIHADVCLVRPDSAVRYILL